MPRSQRRHILQTKSVTASDVLEEVSELASNAAGAASLARTLNKETIDSLRLALIQVKQNSQTKTSSKISMKELRLVALEAGVPFIGFGIIDNSSMIVFGDAIDVSFGVMLGVSTLTSAALGNLISDVLGVGLGGFVADSARKLGLPTATLTLEQTMSKPVRRARTLGCMVGVVIGCLLGMFPLFFLDDSKAERLKRQRRLDELFVTAVKYIANDVLNAESATLFVVDEKKGELWTRASKDLKKDVRLPIDSGLVGHCAVSNMQLNVDDAYKSPFFNREVDRATGFQTRNILCTPVVDRNGRVTGVIEVINKHDGKGGPASFTLDDERLLASMAAHVSVALDDVNSSQKVWGLDPTKANPLLDALKTHKHNYTRFASDSTGIPKIE